MHCMVLVVQNWLGLCIGRDEPTIIDLYRDGMYISRRNVYNRLPFTSEICCILLNEISSHIARGCRPLLAHIQVELDRKSTATLLLPSFTLLDFLRLPDLHHRSIVHYLHRLEHSPLPGEHSAQPASRQQQRRCALAGRHQVSWPHHVTQPKASRYE